MTPLPGCLRVQSTGVEASESPGVDEAVYLDQEMCLKSTAGSRLSSAL